MSIARTYKNILNRIADWYYQRRIDRQHRNIHALRRVAAWALNHHANGGSHDQSAVLKGYADKRIIELASGIDIDFKRPLDLGYIERKTGKDMMRTV